MATVLSHATAGAVPLTSNVVPSVGVTPPVAQVDQRELDNGLQVLVQSDYSAPVVSIQFWVGTGSIHEGPWLGSGISHFLEHMMFKGTARRGNSEMAQSIQALGGHLNAYTSFDRTVYHVDLPSEGWREALDILGDAVLHSTLPEDEVPREQDVIRREFAMGRDNPDRELGKLLFRTAFTRHPYRFPVIGYLDLFDQITREDLQAYYQQRYAVQNIALIVVGAVDSSEVFTTAEDFFGSVTRHWMPDVPILDEPPQQTARSITQHFATELNRLALVYPIPGLHHTDVPALDVLAILLGEGRSSRLTQACVEKSELAEDVEAFAFSPATIGLWGIEARYRPDRHEDLLSRIHEELARIKGEPPREDELRRAKRLTLLQQLHGMRTMSGKAASIGRGWLLGHDPDFSRHYLDRLNHVEAEDVLRVARKYLIEPRENLCVLTPSSTAGGTDSSSATASTDKTTANAEKLKPVDLAKPHRGLHLPSSSLPLVSYRLLFDSSLLNEPTHLAGINRLATQLLTKGTRKRSSEKLAADIEQLGGHLDADGGNNSASLSLELLAPDWESGLDVLMEIVSEPALTEQELATEKRKQIAALKSEQDNPMAIARNIIRRGLFPNHPYSTPILGTASTIESVTRDDIVRYVEGPLLSSGLILAVGGPVDPLEWRALAADRLPRPSGEATSPAPVATVPTPPASPLRTEQLVPKEQAVLQIAFPSAAVDHDDIPALTVLDEALSDLGSRLFIRIREELGLAYFVGTNMFIGRQAGAFLFYAGTDPKRRAEVEAALNEEARHVAANGITDEEFQRAKSKVLSRLKIQSQNPSSVLYAAALDELFGLGYDYTERKQATYEQMTLDQISEVAARYLSTENTVTAIVSPE